MNAAEIQTAIEELKRDILQNNEEHDALKRSMDACLGDIPDSNPMKEPMLGTFQIGFLQAMMWVKAKSRVTPK